MKQYGIWLIKALLKLHQLANMEAIAICHSIIPWWWLTLFMHTMPHMFPFSWILYWKCFLFSFVLDTCKTTVNQPEIHHYLKASGGFRGAVASPSFQPQGIQNSYWYKMVLKHINSCIKCHFYTLQNMMTHTFWGRTHHTPCFIYYGFILASFKSPSNKTCFKF